jgi:transaldolase
MPERRREMHMNRIDELAKLGQSVWIDYIERSMIVSGKLQDLIYAGVRGMTSNPTIFEKAISGGREYDEDLIRLSRENLPVKDIFEQLALWDISHAADLFRPLHDRLHGYDGYISMEVNPWLAYDTDGTIQEATRLFKTLGRPNVMIKVPATEQGLPAIEALIGQGVNVNITLLFSVDRYVQVVEAFMKGLEHLRSTGGDISRIASVASFFVSRVDTAADAALERGYPGLKGKIASANAKIAYSRFRKLFSGDRWKGLEKSGARVQRLLWASTSTKNPAYPDTFYVDGLIGEHTVNTMPLPTMEAFIEHGTVSPTLESGIEEAEAAIRRLSEIGINLDDITRTLEKEGVESFAASYDKLLKKIDEKIK